MDIEFESMGDEAIRESHNDHIYFFFMSEFLFGFHFLLLASLHRSRTHTTFMFLLFFIGMNMVFSCILFYYKNV